MTSSSTCNAPLKYRIYPNVQEFFPNSSCIDVKCVLYMYFPENWRLWTGGSYTGWVCE